MWYFWLKRNKIDCQIDRDARGRQLKSCLGHQIAQGLHCLSMSMICQYFSILQVNVRGLLKIKILAWIATAVTQIWDSFTATRQLLNFPYAPITNNAQPHTPYTLSYLLKKPRYSFNTIYTWANCSHFGRHWLWLYSFSNCLLSVPVHGRRMKYDFKTLL